MSLMRDHPEQEQIELLIQAVYVFIIFRSESFLPAINLDPAEEAKEQMRLQPLQLAQKALELVNPDEVRKFAQTLLDIYNEMTGNYYLDLDSVMAVINPFPSTE